jgi:hypothetical protein
MDQENEPSRPSAKPSAASVKVLQDELDDLQRQNAPISEKFERSNNGQGCLGLVIVMVSTVVGIVIGFGVFSVFTGAGGFIMGVVIAALFMGDSPEKKAYEQRKIRIQELEQILNQLI